MKGTARKTIKSVLALLLVFCLTACAKAPVAGNNQPKRSAEEKTTADAGASTEWMPEFLQGDWEYMPSRSVVYYRCNPSDAIRSELEEIPIIEIEPNGSDELLLISCTSSTQIEICTGEPVWYEEGTIRTWKVDEVVYSNTLDYKQANRFSLTIPTGPPRLCLRFRSEGNDSFGYSLSKTGAVQWHYWPITEMNGYSIQGRTFMEYRLS